MTQIIPKFPECPAVAAWLIEAREKLLKTTDADYGTVRIEIVGYGEAITVTTYVHGGSHLESGNLQDSITQQMIALASPERIEAKRAQASALIAEADKLAERYAEAQLHQKHLPNFHD